MECLRIQLNHLKRIKMTANLKQPLDVIPMTKYAYDKMNNETCYLPDVKMFGYYIESLHIWLSEDNFNKLFVLYED